MGGVGNSTLAIITFPKAFFLVVNLDWVDLEAMVSFSLMQFVDAEAKVSSSLVQFVDLKTKVNSSLMQFQTHKHLVSRRAL